MRTIHVNNLEHWKKIAEEVEICFSPVLDYCISQTDENGELIGAGMVNNYTGAGGSVQCHIAGFRRNWLSRDLLRCYFHFCFEVLKVSKMIGIVPEWRTEALRLDRHLGMVEECRIAGAFVTPEGDPCDAVVLTMTKDQCKWLEKKHGRR